MLTDRRWALYEDDGAARGGSCRRSPRRSPTASPRRRRRRGSAGDAVYLTQPWVELGLVTEEAFGAHLEQVVAGVRRRGSQLRGAPSPRGARRPVCRVARAARATSRPSWTRPCSGPRVVIGTDSTALLNLAAVQGRPALRVTLPQLRHLEDGLGERQRSLLDAFLPPPVDARRPAGS